MKCFLYYTRLMVCFVYIFNTLSAKAQLQEKDTTRFDYIPYYASYEDIKNNHLTELEVKKMKPVACKNCPKDSTYRQQFVLKDKTAKKIIDKKAVGIKAREGVLLNLRFLRRNAFRGFAQAYLIKDGRFVIIYHDVSKMSGMMGMAGMAGLIGAAILASEVDYLRNNKVCYLFTPETNKVVKIKNEVLKNLLVGHDDLFSEYEKLDRYKRNFESIIMPLLRRAEVFM